jgi:hypothetical protein
LRNSENQRTGWIWVFFEKLREAKNRLDLGIFEKLRESKNRLDLGIFEKLRESKNRLVPGVSKSGSLAFKVFSRSVPRAGVSENRNLYIYI